MMVSHRYRCIFAHVPKCAGTSIKNALDLDFIVPPFWHCTWEEAEVALGIEVLNSYFKFAVVRNPWDRVISAWQMFLSKPWSRQERNYSLAEFLQIVTDESIGYRAKYRDTEEQKVWQKTRENIRHHTLPCLHPYYGLVNSTGKVMMDELIRYERINEGFMKVAERLGVPLSSLPRENATKHAHYSTYYDRVTRELVGRIYAEDIRLFEYRFTSVVRRGQSADEIGSLVVTRTRRQSPLVMAYYLPQFHPIPENDAHWGKGFTEWTNTVKAKPLYPGHKQPHLPADLGFYDLRVPETREEQAVLARSHGIDAFCYWHYWFGNGRRALERPFSEVLASGKPDFPFCLAWANDSWTGIWHGAPDKVIIEQTYPGRLDYEQHFHALLPAFRDRRYVAINGSPLFIVQRPEKLPNPSEFCGLWNELARKEGFKGFCFVGIARPNWDHRQGGFDGKTPHVPMFFINRFLKSKRLPPLTIENRTDAGVPAVFNYSEVMKANEFRAIAVDGLIPTVIPNWDNTARSGNRGVVLTDSTPEHFKRHFESSYRYVQSKSDVLPIIFIKSWNEWAEGNYLEPDLEWGTGYLEAIRSVVAESTPV